MIFHPEELPAGMTRCKSAMLSETLPMTVLLRAAYSAASLHQISGSFPLTPAAFLLHIPLLHPAAPVLFVKSQKLFHIFSFRPATISPYSNLVSFHRFRYNSYSYYTLYPRKRKVYHENTILPLWKHLRTGYYRSHEAFRA